MVNNSTNLNKLLEVGCLPGGFSPREDNPARVNNLDVHLVWWQQLFYYTETTYKNNFGMFK